MANTTLTLSSKNYSSWSLRGWLLTKFSGLPFEEIVMPVDDPGARAELLLLSPSILVPCLFHDGIKVWDTLAIAEYLNEVQPDARLLPQDRRARAHCRAISGEMHSGFGSLRSALPMNLKAHFPGFKVWARAQSDIDRIVAIWRECLEQYGGPYLFGERSEPKPECISPLIARQCARARRSCGSSLASGCTSFRYSAIASVSQTSTPSTVRHGVRNEGDSSKSSARAAASSSATFTVSNSSPANLHSSQPRRHQLE